MRMQGRFVRSFALLMCALVGSTVVAVAQPQRPQRERDPLSFLKRALTEASAPALTTAQETQLNALITSFREAQPDGPDEQLDAARTAYNNALLAGDVATATAQAAIIANRSGALLATRLQADTEFKIAVLTVLKSGGQLDALQQKFGAERVLGIVGSLAGGRGFGGPGGPGGPGRGFGPPPDGTRGPRAPGTPQN
jgi:hypothetical protein